MAECTYVHVSDPLRARSSSLTVTSLAWDRVKGAALFLGGLAANVIKKTISVMHHPSEPHTSATTDASSEHVVYVEDTPDETHMEDPISPFVKPAVKPDLPKPVITSSDAIERFRSCLLSVCCDVW